MVTVKGVVTSAEALLVQVVLHYQEIIESPDMNKGGQEE